MYRQLSKSILVLVTAITLMYAAGTSAPNYALAYDPGVPIRGASPYVITPRGAVTLPTYSPYGVQYGGNPYYNNPYGYGNPGTGYGGYPYSTYYGRYNIGGITTPVYGLPQPIAGGLYGINVGGVPSQFWRAPSGFYYPWAPGYGYTSYPIYVVPPNTNAPNQTLPPINTVVSDLNEYLDKAKEKGKINAGDYQSLRRRASDLLSKEKSLAYEQGGTIDPDQEADIRRDIEELSAEVAHRVRP